MSTIYRKDPAARLNYSIDWVEWLAGDTITLSEWTVPEGLTEHGDIHGSGVATILLGGGVDGCDYRVTNKITTAGGLINLRSFVLQVRVPIEAVALANTTAKQILDAIDAMLLGKATLDQQEYQIGDRQLRRIPIPDLLTLRETYARLYSQEQQAARLTKGGPFFKTVLTRFGTPE